MSYNRAASLRLSMYGANNCGRAKNLVLKEVGGEAIRQSLQEQLEGLDPGAGEEDDPREMLETLIGFLS